MADSDSIFLGKGEAPQSLKLSVANRHGLIAGATGTGKTATLRVLAEGFSRAGVPVFAADIKGDLAGLCQPAEVKPFITERLQKIGVTDWKPTAHPVVFWDLFGELGHPLRATVSEMGPTLLARMLQLNDTQEGVLNILFRVADEQGMLLLDLKDLRAMLVNIGENADKYTMQFGNIAPASIGARRRAIGADFALDERLPALAIPALKERWNRRSIRRCGGGVDLGGEHGDDGSFGRRPDGGDHPRTFEPQDALACAENLQLIRRAENHPDIPRGRKRRRIDEAVLLFQRSCEKTFRKQPAARSQLMNREVIAAQNEDAPLLIRLHELVARPLARGEIGKPPRFDARIGRRLGWRRLGGTRGKDRERETQEQRGNRSTPTSHL